MQHMEWKGSHPERFSGGKKQYGHQDELNYMLQSANIHNERGIRVFGQKLSDQYQFKPCLKVYQDQYNSQQKEIDLRGIKPIKAPQQIQRIRKEKGHVVGGLQCTAQQQLKGIKTFTSANQTKGSQYGLQAKMQAKIRIFGLEAQRNGLGVTSLGDKSYKYPQYQTNFYNSGGLVAGSTSFKLRPGQIPTDPAKLKSIFTKPMWTQKVKMEQEAEEKKLLGSTDQWEQTVLKDANPKWNDPETFFQRMEKAANAGGKDVKKGAKK